MIGRRSTMIGVIVACAVTSLAMKGTTADAPKCEAIRVEEIGNKYELIGKLGFPLGTYMTVEGDYFGVPAMTKCGLYVDQMGKKSLSKTIAIHVDDDGLPSRLEAGKRYQLRGFETGGMQGVPYDPQHLPTVEERQKKQSDDEPRLQFETRFYVTGVEVIGRINKK